MREMFWYEVRFRLNIIDFRCEVFAQSKKRAIADVLWNINLRTLSKIRGITATRIER